MSSKTEPTRHQPSLGRRAFFSLSLAGCLVLASGCSPYPRVSGGEGIKFIGALRTACSSKSSGRLDKAEAAIRESHAEGTVTADELAAYESIIALAREGKWKDAEMAAYHFQKAQVR